MDNLNLNISGGVDIAKKYQKLSPIQHVLKRPGMYIGGVEEVEQQLWVLESSEKIVEKTIKYSPGLYKIFDEIIVNSYDQTIRDNTVTTIKVDIDREKNQITVYNNGKGIDVVIHPKEKIYVPELIFGHLRTSTTFSEDEGRITGGVHGLGAKLTAIFSSYFKVEVGDPVNKKKFSQFYKNNLSTKSKPIISPYNKTDGYVKITFIPDLKYFKLQNLSQDLISLMNRRVYDLSALTKKEVKVYLDGNRIQFDTLEKYVSLYTDQPLIKETCDPSSLKFDEGRWRIIVTKSDGNYKQVSFVNGIYTMNGGKHVDYIVSRVVKNLTEYAQKKFKSTGVKTQFVRDQLWFFIVSVIEDATFSSQTKDELVTPVNKFGSTCVIPENLTRKIYTKFELDNIISQYVKFTQNVALGKLDAKKTKTVKGIKKLYDANFAGTAKSNVCTLILTEGDSAKTMAISGLSAIPKGNNFYGVFPLRGKLLNVREATHNQIVNNEEFKNLKKILGLQTGKKYDKENLKELRYGSILLMMDADVDGSHIKGLFINMLHFFWPSLIKLDGFLKVFITPVVKVTSRSSKSQVLSFYTLDLYEKWKKTVDTQKWFIKYYKGLGANTPEEAKEYFRNLDKHVIQFNYVLSTDDAIQLAFSKDKADDRKKWLKVYDPDDNLDYTQKLFTYKDFIHKELKHFSNYDNIRSIPSIVDGFKPSQRKVLYSAFKRNLTQEVKVAQFVGYVSEHSSYHHGETSLANTVIGMAQNYVGSNNINLLVPNGQFGCIDPETPVLMWDSTIKKAKEIRVNDKLIGDDGTIRTVSKITSGIDDMYEIENGRMDNYIVNSNHILTVSYSGHKSIFWKESTRSWNINYFDDKSKSVKSKSIKTYFDNSKLTKKEAHKQILEFANTISDNNVFDINIQDYLRLPKHAKHKIKGVLNSSIIRWKNQNIDIDPYILGLWLGDGISDCSEFSKDPEIIQSWVTWLDKIGCEEINLNPFKELFKKNNLYKNKHVPKQYIINSKGNRLQILAGMIDSIGTLYKQGDEYRYEISQQEEKKHIIESFRIIAGSLGYKAKLWKNGKIIKLVISGYGLENIPTKLTRKQITTNKIRRNPMIHNLKVKYIGRGKFCGWNIDRNERFLLGDFTITHNTRLQGGKDHSSPRYIYTKLNELTRYIFHKDDDPLLNYLNDDGLSIEPEYYVPIIPMILVNGTDGIGTGYSTFLPKFNPVDIIDNLERRLTGQNFVPMTPWYNGFNGDIVKKDSSTYFTKGSYDIDKNVVTIKELPITSWTEPYKIFLETAISPLQNIKNVRNNSTESIVDFSIRFDEEKTVKSLLKKADKHIDGLEKMFYLVRVINLSNMHLYSPDNVIKKYGSAQAILEEFFIIRLEFYKRRKDYLIKKLEDEIKILKSKVKFVELVVNKKIVLFNKSKEQIIKILKEQKLLLLSNEPPFDYLIKMSFYSLTKEKIDELKAQLKKKTSEYNILKNKKIEQIWLDDLKELKSML